MEHKAKSEFDSELAILVKPENQTMQSEPNIEIIEGSKTEVHVES